MTREIQVVSILVAVGVILFVVHLIRRRKLSEEYALLWFVGSVALLGLAAYREVMISAARFFGVAYPPSLLLLGAIFFGFLLAIHYSVSLSRLNRQMRRLAQDLALLRYELDTARAGESSKSA